MTKKTNIPPQMIGITGTHGIGKTTLAEHLAYIANDMGIKATVLSEVVRTLQNDPRFKIHEEQDIETTNLIIEKQIELEDKLEASDYDIVFCDRTVLDPLYYFFATKTYRPMFEDWLWNDEKIEGLKYSIGLCARALLLFRYDNLIFAEIPNSETKIEDDGFRDVDLNYQKEVQDIALEIRQAFPKKVDEKIYFFRAWGIDETYKKFCQNYLYGIIDWGALCARHNLFRRKYQQPKNQTDSNRS